MNTERLVKIRVFLAKAIIALMVVTSLTIVCGMPVFAAKCGGAETSLIKCDDNEGGIWHIVNLVIEILSIGVGILGVIGISVAGVQVLTAKDSPEQVKKAKNRLGEIVIGLALYAALFVVIEWLLPGGLMNAQSGLQGVGTTTQIEEIEKQQEEARKKAEQGDSPNSGGTNNPSNKKSKAEQIADVAWKIAKGKLDYDTVANSTGYYDYMEKNCGKIGGGDCNRGKKGYRTFCSGFVYNVVRYSGADPRYPMKLTGKQMEYANGSSRWQNVTNKVNGKTSKLKAGDVLIKSGHTLLITQNSKGQLYTAQAAVGNFEPKTSKLAGGGRLDNSAGNLSKYQVFRIVE